MWTKRVIPVAGFFLCAFSLFAQEAPTPATETEVRKLIEVMGMKKMMDNMLPQMMQQMQQHMDQTVERQLANSELPADFQETQKKIRDFLFERVTEEFRQFDIESIAAKIYARHFTVEEIQGITAFYQSPLGQKMLTTTPTIMQETMAETFAQTQHMTEKVMQDLKKKFPEIFDPPKP